ncbi:MAG: c-type cytochrome [Thermochromatium sp.]
MKKIWLTTISVATVLASGLAQAAEEIKPADPARGETKANAICMACHGPQGNSVVPLWPKLAGQHPEYIIKQLKNFKAGERYNVQMTPMAMPLTEQEMIDLAAYFSTQTQSGGTADPKLAKQGEALYRAGNPATGVPACSACHGPAGMGQGLSKFPRLAGQHADYVKQTLEHFRSGERANDPNGIMRGVAARLTDQEIAALSQYIQGLSN